MPIKNKQTAIVEELKKRIDTGFYKEKLPKALDLADEFEVNFKTLNKAVRQLVEDGIVYRKAGLGTFIRDASPRLEDTLIEVLFVGSSEMSTHPFYSEIWTGILDSIKDTGFKLVLTMLEEDAKDGGIKEACTDFTASAGKILIGSSNEEQIKRLKREQVPFVLLGSKTPVPDVVSVYTDTEKAINSAVSFLRKQQIEDIAYIGITHSEGEHLIDLDKFHAYLSAVQKKGKFDSDLIEHSPPLAKFGYESMRKILKRKQPGAVLVAYDHLAPGVYCAIDEAGLKIPDDISVIGIDGITQNVTPELTSIPVDRYKMGFEGGKVLLDMIREPSKNKNRSLVFSAAFEKDAGESICT